MLDLRCGKCKICVAGYEKPKERITSNITRVATKYPRVAKMYYDEKGEGIEIIKLHGSIELAPILDLSDVIVDIVAVSYTHLDVYKRQVEGGQSMNPSTDDILHAIKNAPSRNVIVLPNNKNIILEMCIRDSCSGDQ